MNQSQIFVDSSGWLRFEGAEYQCAIGRGGLSQVRIEGDGTTPIGIFQLRDGLYRADREKCPDSGIDFTKIRKNDAWCDDPSDCQYNKRVKLPYPARYENLWREDNIYDIIVPIGFNDSPPVVGRGSAVFLHVAQHDYAPTEGCVALARDDLKCLLSTLKNEAMIKIGTV